MKITQTHIYRQTQIHRYTRNKRIMKKNIDLKIQWQHNQRYRHTDVKAIHGKMCTHKKHKDHRDTDMRKDSKATKTHTDIQTQKVTRHWLLRHRQ